MYLFVREALVAAVMLVQMLGEQQPEEHGPNSVLVCLKKLLIIRSERAGGLIWMKMIEICKLLCG